ncbi:MAG: RsmB/NOP family class I SAM-dependent RNA methyltransferase [Candidatus Omnitrophica bacterium]|nr:RsmB/NOP family class I SAM-dependent RNA methyltransferase [Candidatus Omnitrophota bacterium]
MKRINPRFLHSQLNTAALIWEDIQNSTEPADRWLANFFYRNRKKFGSRDRRFFSETIYGLFRHKLFLESWSRELGHDKDPSLMVLMASLKEGLVSGDEFEEHTAASFPGIKTAGAVEQALKAHDLPAGLNFNSPEEKISIQYSVPLWLVKRWKQRFGEEECCALLASTIERPPLVVRINPLKMARERQIGRFEKWGWRVFPTERSPWGLVFKERVHLFDTEDFQKGFFEIQDEGSQIICQMIDAKPGEVVWDVCAGGGGKSLLLAAMMQNKGRIIATDIKKWKLEELRKRFRRAGAMNIFPAELERISESREMKKGVDKILIDAPCSGTGTLRRNPDAKWKIKEEKFADFHKEQVAIIEKSLPFLKKGGRLYYATCSLEPEENEEVMAEIFARHPELQKIAYPYSKDGFFRLYPHKNQTDGFFLAMAENKVNGKGENL